MEIQEAITRKTDLEREIESLIVNFQTAVGVDVLDLSYQTVDASTFNDSRRMLTPTVKLDIGIQALR